MVFRYFNSTGLIRFAVYGFDSIVMCVNSRSDSVLSSKQRTTLNGVVDAQSVADFTRENAQNRREKEPDFFTLQFGLPLSQRWKMFC